MPVISAVRPVLLSAPYANLETNKEVLLHLPTGYRTCGMVEITLDDGTKGLGEGYLAVFAPKVFVEIVNLLSPVLIGRDIQDFETVYRDLCRMTGYWSLQGAAQHVISAFEIALCDCRAKCLGVPVYALLNKTANPELKLYASGGDSTTPQAMQEEIDEVAQLGIDVFKIRARAHELDKVLWCQTYNPDVQIAVDMTQNLAIPSQTLAEVLNFLEDLEIQCSQSLAFLEEALGPDQIESFPALSTMTSMPIAGGEIVTTADELIKRIKAGYYDIVQPDATVMGGITPLLNVTECAKKHRIQTYVHCWGGPVGMMANYHAAIAAGTEVAEWPLPQFALRQAMIVEPWSIQDGRLTVSDVPGLGIKLTEQIEADFPFRETAVYRCLTPSVEQVAVTW